MTASAPVGVFDSGMGGLSVAREIHARLPAEDILYAADTAYVPYGGRSLAEIRERSLLIGRHLERRGAKALVVACNTASGAALEDLREVLGIPVIGLEPAVKPAAECTRNGRIGVMATSATLRTERFRRLVESYARGVEVHAQACPGLVELVEEGRMEGEEVESALSGLLEALRTAGVDTVVLGCTHYPYLRSAVAAVMGPAVHIIDSGAAVARQVERVLAERGALLAEGRGELRALTSGDPARVAPVVERLWGGPVLVEHFDPEAA